MIARTAKKTATMPHQLDIFLSVAHSLGRNAANQGFG